MTTFLTGYIYSQACSYESLKRPPTIVSVHLLKLDDA